MISTVVLKNVYVELEDISRLYEKVQAKVEVIESVEIDPDILENRDARTYYEFQADLWKSVAMFALGELERIEDNSSETNVGITTLWASLRTESGKRLIRENLADFKEEIPADLL